MSLRKRALAACASLLFIPASWALEPFTVREIRAEGLQRLDEGTILTYLPLTTGDELNDITSRQAIRALYASGLFQDVQLLRDGNALVIRVEERPQIVKFEIEGNEKIGGDELKKSLADLGLANGETYKRALLDQVEQELRRQYYANGYYDVGIDTTVTDLANNRVDIKIKVTEGKVTKIKDINILGATAFPVKELKEQLQLKPTNWVPFQKSDRYSKQSLGGDLETLQSYYQDRGYLKFNVASVQVALSPEKKDIFITVNVEEGDKYSLKDRRFSGETILNEEFLFRLLSTKPGDTFSRKEATESANRIEAALSDVGYAFAKVTPLPEVDEEKKQVSLNYVIEPGKRAYVRRINFTGHGDTNDETLRREMRQLEASPFSKSAVERSRVRLTRLPFIEEAEVDTKPVPGSDDLVDVSFKIKERAPGSVQFGVGYSGAQGFLVNASLTHTNFLGTGNRVELSIDNSQYSRQLNFSWTNPYFTEDGISQTISTYYRKAESVIRYSSGFNSNTIGADLTYGIPLSEFVALRIGGGVTQTAIETFPAYSADEVLRFVRENGSSFTDFTLRTGITRDTRNRTFFASRGTLNRLNLDVTVPGSGIEFYNLFYQHQQYIPLFYKFFIEFDGTVGYVDTYGDSSTVPPYENYFAGGPRTVRGYKDGTLGPRDTPFNNPYGGKLRTTAQTELIIPTPLDSDGKSSRVSLFYDVGNIFAEPGQFEVNELRQSMGLAVSYFTPFLGLLQLSYSFPLNAKPQDEVDRFQITFGSGF
ncbi:outer membrane protein assembly factor BamA [Stagnimonas aquatica]|uniref:Outer membrane protein assembly factor BamA n=1 Tax=Stagnimonas aquatica TaxID=2689987 RepID=A0A3N0VEV9_9GAMM|nr:outer membrane protein assembly factor BamA [Stagnimonas aquatica]